MRRLLENPELRVRLGRQGRDLVQNSFSRDRMLDGLEHLLAGRDTA